MNEDTQKANGAETMENEEGNERAQYTHYWVDEGMSNVEHMVQTNPNSIISQYGKIFEYRANNVFINGLERTINYCQDCKNWLCENCGTDSDSFVKGDHMVGKMYKVNDGITNNSPTYRLGLGLMNLDGE
jgi:uncharacterized short protein YbdD (DUF466 family)